MAYRSFEDLEVWKRACVLATEIIEAMRSSREYAIRDQMVRAALSVPSNIAEGSERDSRPDYIRFLRIAKGSAAELRTQCYIAGRLGLLEPASITHYIQELKEISAMLQGLIRSLSLPIPPSNAER